MVNSERNSLAHQNNDIKRVLAQYSIDAQVDAINLSSPSSSEELSSLDTAALNVRFDEDIGQTRLFLDFLDGSDMQWTSASSSNNSQPRRPVRHAPVAGDSWAALDFILAVEWPCREHIRHHIHNPNVKVPEACVVGKWSVLMGKTLLCALDIR